MRRRTWLGLIPVLGLVTILSAPVGTIALAHVRGSWSALPELPDEATITTAVGGHNGRLYVFGICQVSCLQTNGIVSHGAPVTYVYNEALGIWRSGRGAPKVCRHAQAAAVGTNGKIRLAGCWTDKLTDPGFRIAVYDTSSKTWTLNTGYGPYVNPIAGMTDRAGHVLWYSETLRNDGSAVFVSGHRVVQSISGVWYRRAKEPAGGPSDGAAVGADGRVYVVGGSRNCFPQFGACPVPPVAAWSPVTNSWSKPTSLPTPRIRVAVTADAQGRIFVIGGIAGDGSQAYDAVSVYRTDLKSWFSTRRLPSPRFGAVATSTSDGRVYVMGGYDAGGNPLSDGYVFDPG
jgi:hypothetical protein